MSIDAMVVVASVVVVGGVVFLGALSLAQMFF